MSAGLEAAKKLVDAAIIYDSTVLKDKKSLVDKVINAVNSVLSNLSKYQNDGVHLRPYVEEYVETCYKKSTD